MQRQAPQEQEQEQEQRPPGSAGPHASPEPAASLPEPLVPGHGMGTPLPRPLLQVHSCILLHTQRAAAVDIPDAHHDAPAVPSARTVPGAHLPSVHFPARTFPARPVRGLR
jgi:hypothetical protein